MNLSHYSKQILFSPFSAYSRAASCPTYSSIACEAAQKSAKKCIKNHLYCERPETLNLDSARQSQIEAVRSERRSPAPSGQVEEEDRFDKVAASPNSKFPAARSIFRIER